MTRKNKSSVKPQAKEVAEVVVKVDNAPSRGRSAARSDPKPGKLGSEGRRGASRSRTPGGREKRDDGKSPSRGRSKSRPRIGVSITPTDGADWVGREIAAVPKNRQVFTVNNTIHAEIDPYVVTGSSGAANVWNLAVWHLIKAIQARAPTFFRSTAGDDYQSVQVAAWALHVAILDYFRRTGQLSANYVSSTSNLSLPELGDDVPIPISLAYLLHHCAPYRKDGFDFKFNFQGTGSFPTLDTTNNAMSSTKTDWTYAPYSVYNYALDGLGDFHGVAGASETLATILGKISGCLGRIGSVIDTVPIGKIALTAPDCSAYAMLLYNNTDNLAVITSARKDFDAELAFMFGVRTTTVEPCAYKKLPPEIQNLYTARAMWGETGILRRATMVLSAVEHGLWVQYRPQSFKRAIWYSKLGNFKQILVEVVDMDMRLWHAYVGLFLCNLAQDSSVTFPDVNTFLKMCIVADSILLNRLRMFAHIMGPSQAYSVCSDDFGAPEVPAAMANFLRSLGPANRGGQMVLVLPIATGGGALLASTTNTFATAATSSPFHGVMINSAVAAGSPLSITITFSGAGAVATTVTWNAATFPTVNIYGLTPMDTNAKTLTRTWNFYCDAGKSAPNPIGFYSQDNNIPSGGVSNLVFADIVAYATGQPVVGIAAATVASFDIAITGAVSLVFLSKTALENALACIVRAGTVNRQTTPYGVNFDSINPATFMVTADRDEVIVEAAKYRVANSSGFVSVGGVPLDITTSNPVTEALAPLFTAALQGMLPPSMELGNVLLKEIPAYTDNQFASLFPDVKPGSTIAKHLEEVFRRAQANPKKKLSFGQALKEGFGAVAKGTGEVLGQVVGRGIQGLATGLGGGAGATMGRF